MSTPRENPYIGKIARNFDEMKLISELSRKYEGTGQGTRWVDTETREEIFTNY